MLNLFQLYTVLCADLTVNNNRYIETQLHHSISHLYSLSLFTAENISIKVLFIFLHSKKSSYL